MARCEKCGSENPAGSRFCTACGNQLQPEQKKPEESRPLVPSRSEVPSERPEFPPPVPEGPVREGEESEEGEGQAGGQAAAAPVAAVPPQAPPARPGGAPPPAGEAPYYPPPEQPYQVPPGAPRAAYPPPLPARRRKGPLFWAGAALVFVSGVLVLVSTWMTWASGPAGIISYSGWDWYNLGNSGLLFGRDSISNAFFIYTLGYPIFTGLCSLILGGAIAFFALFMIGLRMKGLAVITLILAIIALGLAITDMVTFMRISGMAIGSSIQAGVGAYIFVIFSALGLGGSIAALAS